MLDFAEFVSEIEAFLKAGGTRAALVDPEGRQRLIPDDVFRVLEQVTNALAAGNGITVAPNELRMTTQQAADFLGISRPTLVKLLETGQIPFERPGRHRRIALRDLTAYQKTFARLRESALDDLARETPSSTSLNTDPTALDRLDTAE
jgi:excisionase family DNA binding protein